MFKEKLHKKLAAALEKHGITEPTPLQQPSLPGINAGTDMVISGPKGSGKSSLIAISAVHKLHRAFEDAPRALVLVASKEKAVAMKELFLQLAEDTDLRTVAAFDEGKLEEQNRDIYFGTDLVIGTPKRTLELYLTRNLNLNKLKLFVIDDAELMVKNAWQGQIDRLGLSLPKCQRLFFTSDLNEKVQKLVDKFTNAPQVVEVD
jgi:ATP-dependent RNA helicase RhlE